MMPASKELQDLFEEVTCPSFGHELTYAKKPNGEYVDPTLEDHWQTFQEAAEVVLNACIDIIETFQIPVGNSAAGELACEWTYDALKDIRDSIKEKFGVVG